LVIEKTFGSFDYIAASDECGRGPLAGPVLSCSIGIPFDLLDSYLNEWQKLGVRDSKKLTHIKIEKIINALQLPEELPRHFKHKKLLKTSIFKKLDIVVSANSSTYIDQNNILIASLDSMKTSFLSLRRMDKKNKKTLWLVDGPFSPQVGSKKGLHVEPLIKGDSRSTLIALSSVIAKYYRDKIMEGYDKTYPGYGFKNHKGYPTVAHLDAIKNLGPSEIHRRTYKGVKKGSL
jgi:ribonuclease HII